MGSATRDEEDACRVQVTDEQAACVASKWRKVCEARRETGGLAGVVDEMLGLALAGVAGVKMG